MCSTSLAHHSKLNPPGLLSDHEKVHTASVTPRICETCGKSFKYLAHLVLHQRKHRERQPSVCSDCGKQFSTKDYLRAAQCGQALAEVKAAKCTIITYIVYCRVLLMNSHIESVGEN
uniref:C2H2-type domain-containing protein n=1 Tax=Dicentrarchus labrax TaxID=13489 RepID=A0A8C4I172_DICLA